jgi:hypothetical protein
MRKIQVFKSQDMLQEEESRRLVMKEHIQVFTKNTLDGLTQELKNDEREPILRSSCSTVWTESVRFWHQYSAVFA